MSENCYILLHNVNSINIVVEFANIVLGFNIGNIIISKAEGSAAMSGVPAAHKLAFKNNKNLLYFADISDVIELIQPHEILLCVSKRYTDNFFDEEKVIDLLKQNKKVLIAFSGQKSGFSKQEMDYGLPVSLDIPSDISVLGSAAIILYKIFKCL
ncbi:MAG: RecB-family nuclease [Candidatus Helarchaeota archaeon]